VDDEGLTDESENLGARRNPPAALGHRRQRLVRGRELADGDELDDVTHDQPQSVHLQSATWKIQNQKTLYTTLRRQHNLVRILQ
jgi:hypothetical protein